MGSDVVEQHDRERTQPVGIPEPHRADQGRRARFTSRKHRRRVANLKTGFFGVVLVSGDFVGSGRGTPATDREWVQRGHSHPVHAAYTRVELANGFAGLVHNLGIARHLDSGLVDAVHLANRIDEADVEGVSRFAVTEGDRAGGADVGVGAGVGSSEDAVEGGFDGVGQDEGAGEKRHTQDDRK